LLGQPGPDARPRRLEAAAEHRVRDRRQRESRRAGVERSARADQARTVGGVRRKESALPRGAADDVAYRALMDPRARSGRLEDTPYAAILLSLAAGETSAVLELRRNQLQKTIVFDAGSPIDCRSNIATEMLSRFLVSTGKLKAADENTALSESYARGVPVGEVLIERKLLTPTDLYRALQQNLGRKLLEPFSWTTGTWSISLDVPPSSSVLRVKVPQLIVTGIQKVEPQEHADAAVANARGAYLSLTENPRFPLDDVRLTANQQKVVDAARRAATLDELRASGIDGDDLNRTLYALLLLGAIETTDQPVRERPKEAPPVEAPPPPPPARVDAAAAEEVMSAYLSCRRK